MKQDPPLLIGVWSNDPGNDITAIFILFLNFFFLQFFQFFFFSGSASGTESFNDHDSSFFGFTPDVSQWFLASSIS